MSGKDKKKVQLVYAPLSEEVRAVLFKRAERNKRRVQDEAAMIIENALGIGEHSGLLSLAQIRNTLSYYPREIIEQLLNDFEANG